MKKELMEMKMPAYKKKADKGSDMMDMDAIMKELGLEKPDSKMDALAEEGSPEPEMSVEMEMEGPESEAGMGLASLSDEELMKELKKRKLV